MRFKEGDLIIKIYKDNEEFVIGKFLRYEDGDSFSARIVPIISNRDWIVEAIHDREINRVRFEDISLTLVSGRNVVDIPKVVRIISEDEMMVYLI